MRRNIVRYAILAYVITLQRVSLRVKRRFPTWQHVVDSGKCAGHIEIQVSRLEAKVNVVLCSRSYAGKRKEGIREDGRKESYVKVLDAFSVGDEHNQSRAQGRVDY